MKELLAQSKNYKLYGIYEEAHLEGANIDGHIIVGDFYGSVDCACIDQNEKWCISGGNGIVIYRLESPYENYQYNKNTTQWKELWRDEKDWYPEVIYQETDNSVRIVIDVYSDAKGVYELNVETLELVKLV